MTDADINEKYFKALGWIPGEHKKYGEGWKVPCGTPKGTMLFHMGDLPNPCQHYPDFKKYVLEVMQNERMNLEVNTNIYRIEWFCHPSGIRYEKKIIDGEILRAAVEAATKYMEAK